MPLFSTKEPICVVFLLMAFIAVAFHPLNSDKGKLQLRGISTATNKTVISYNGDSSIAEMLTIYKTAEGSYTMTRIPVYKNGRLVKYSNRNDQGRYLQQQYGESLLIYIQ
jgi:hypothetical protein